MSRIAKDLAEINNTMIDELDIVKNFSKSETRFLRKMGKGDGSDAEADYRTLQMMNHWGKTTVRGLLDEARPEIASSIARTQFGALPKRGTRDAIGIVLGLFRN